ncbi:winged helix-turn-helix domain-containing protein [Micromonospora arborensis]|uniref:winged helix-turn-helix domain-containing protein n=1 Tax=Micromonospora arborensis TaxID=2116518 RepID=UPI0033E2BD3A
MTDPEQAEQVRSADLAAQLRDQILTGQLPPGARIPSDRWLQETYGVSRNLVRAAIAVLRGEGLVVTRQGQTSRVRPEHVKQPIDLTNVVRVETRVPTAPERQKLDDTLPDGLDEGVAVFVVWRLDPAEPEQPAQPELLPGDRWFFPGTAQVEAR